MNFLRHLLQRSLAPVPTLQPRLASRFEFNANQVRPTELAIETEAATPVAPAPLPLVAGFAAPPVAPRAETAQSAAPSASMPAPPPAAPPPVFATPRPLTVPPIPPAATPAPAALPPVAPLAIPSNSNAHEVVSMPPASSTTLLIERVTERIRENYAVPANGTSSSAGLQAAPIAAPALMPATPPAPKIAPVSPGTAPVSQPSVTPAAPIIRVTIGRVDIRAIQATPTAPVRVSTPVPRPLVSLETYLNQRDAK